MLKFFVKLLLCLTTLSLAAPGRKTSANSEATPAPKEQTAANSQPVTFLAPDAVFEGTLKSEGDIEIRGVFHGKMSSKGHILLCTDIESDIHSDSIVILGSTVTGNVYADSLITLDSESQIVGNTHSNNLVCAGQIKGNLDIKESINLTPQARVEGDIVTGSMTMSEGAFFKGNIKMGSR